MLGCSDLRSRVATPAFLRRERLQVLPGHSFAKVTKIIEILILGKLLMKKFNSM